MSYFKINKKIKTKKDFIKILTKNEKKTKLITFINPFSYNVFLNEPDLLEEFDSLYADGSLLVSLHNLFNKNKIDRVSFDFSSIATNVLEYSTSKKLRISFIGAKKEELNIALSNIANMFPNINIVYHRDGYFNSEKDYEECFESLDNQDIDLLIIGMGSPYQEKFAVMIKNRKINIPLVFTCGGFLTQTSIKPDYYHPLIKKLGLRWLQRAWMHKHVRDRLIKDYDKLYNLSFIKKRYLKQLL